MREGGFGMSDASGKVESAARPKLVLLDFSSVLLESIVVSVARTRSKLYSVGKRAQDAMGSEVSSVLSVQRYTCHVCIPSATDGCLQHAERSREIKHGMS